MKRRKVLMTLPILLLSFVFNITTTSTNKLEWKYSCVDDLKPTIMGQIIKRYKVSNDCGQEFLCTMTCLPVSPGTSTYHHINLNNSSKFNLKLSIESGLLENLEIVRNKQELSIGLHQKHKSTNQTVTTAPTTTEVLKTKTDTQRLDEPKAPCNCLSITGFSTTPATTTATTEIPHMPCPCIPVSQFTSEPSVPNANETTRELKIKLNSVYEKPDNSTATVISAITNSTLAANSNCVSNVTSTN